MANRVMKCVKSPSNGLTVLSVGFRWANGVKRLTSDDPLDPSGTIQVSASDAKSVSFTFDNYAEIVAIHASVAADGGAPLTLSPGQPRVSQGRNTLPFSVKGLTIADDGGDPVLAVADNTKAYTAFVTFVLKNSKARP